MPLMIVFDCQDLPQEECDRIKAAVSDGAQDLAGEHIAWIVPDRAADAVKLLITGPNGFERMMSFALDEAPSIIVARVRDSFSQSSGAP